MRIVRRVAKKAKTWRLFTRANLIIVGAWMAEGAMKAIAALIVYAIVIAIILRYFKKDAEGQGQPQKTQLASSSVTDNVIGFGRIGLIASATGAT